MNEQEKKEFDRNRALINQVYDQHLQGGVEWFLRMARIDYGSIIELESRLMEGDSEPIRQLPEGAMNIVRNLSLIGLHVVRESVVDLVIES